MKALIISLTLLPLFSAAQYTCVPIEDVHWVNRFQQFDDYFRHLLWQYVEHYSTGSNDTIINGTEYYPVYSDQYHLSYFGAVRADSNTMYILPANDSIEYVVITFNVVQGDIIHDVYTVDGLMDYYIDTVGFNQFGQVDFVALDSYSILNYWYRDSGPDGGIFWNSPRANFSGYITGLECASQHDTTFFPSYAAHGCAWNISTPELETKHSVTFHPNPAQSFIKLSHFDGVQSVIISDLHGKTIINSPAKEVLITSELPEGIYTLRVNYADGFSHFEKLIITR